MSKRYFYGRVSSKKQNLDRQILSAKSYKDHYDRIFTDKKSGKDFDREGYVEMKSVLEKGDEVVIHALDRLGRNKEEMKNELAWFKENGIIVRILNVPTTLIEFPEGQEWVMDMVNNILVEVLGAVAQQERDEMLVRQAEGIAAMPVDEEGYKVSKKTGNRFGRKAMSYPDNFREVYERQQRGEITLKEALAEVGIGRTKWYELARGVA